jgi:hypothetical protein
MKLNSRVVLPILICLAVVSPSCMSGSVQPSSTPTVPPATETETLVATSPTPSSTSRPPATATETRTRIGPAPNLTARPQIWFGPQIPNSATGPPDYFDLFKENAAWQQAARGIHVFMLYGPWVNGRATDAELEQAVADIQRRGLGIGFEFPPLQQTAECTHLIEGFGDPLWATTLVVTRIQQAGGTADYAFLEHPYDAVTYSDAPPACRYSAERAAQDVALFVQSVRSVFPDIRIGAIETADHSVEAVTRWVEAYRAVVGEDLDSFSFDLDYYRPDWPQQARAIEAYVHGQGMEFGMYYRGNENAASAAEWVATAEQRFVEYEVIAGGRPERAIFQSWHPQPDHVLPETDPGALTYLVNRYLRTRTKLTLEAQTASAGGVTLRGALTDERGTPRSNADLAFSMTPLDGPGVVSEYTFSGKVPERAVQAVVGYRVNMECDDCSGPSDFTLYEVHYTEGEGQTNRVPNWRFANGLKGWGATGETWALVASDQGPGSALHVSVQPGQMAAIDSTSFGVTAGATFTATFMARIAPASEGSGYFSVFFLGPSQEIYRIRIPLRAERVPVEQTVAGGGGEFEFHVPDAPAWPVLFQVWYAGDDEHWPAYAEAEWIGQ